MGKYITLILGTIFYSQIHAQNYTVNASITKENPSLTLSNSSLEQFSNSGINFKADNVPSQNYYMFYAHKNIADNAGFWNYRFVKKNETYGYITYLMFQDETNDIRFNVNNSFTNGEDFGNILFENGNVGIGTTSPDELLTVAGTVHSQEVKVTVNAGADYVFADDYSLRSLEETKTFIAANQHLPEVPSAQEMETNGIQLGEMNILLLKKIEELTLYQIQLLEKLSAQQSEINTQQSEIDAQQTEINSQQEQINTLKELITNNNMH